MKPYTIFLTTLWLTLISLAACQPNSTTIQSKNLVLDWFRGPATVPTPPKISRHCFTNLPPATNHPPHWLLAVAANTGDLKEANHDAQRFKQAMQKRYSIPDPQICVLDDVYRQELVEALQVLKERVTDKDLAIIYFSGHGSQLLHGGDRDTIDEALVTYDVQGQELTETTPCDDYVLRDKSFVALVNALPTTRVLTVIDACFSGGMYMPPTIDRLPEARSKYFANGCLGTQPRPPADTTKKLDNLKGLFLAASSEGELAWEYEKGWGWKVSGRGGIFTTKLIEALAQAPMGKFEDAFKRTAEQVSKEIKELKQKEQHPKDIGRWEVVE